MNLLIDAGNSFIKWRCMGLSRDILPSSPALAGAAPTSTFNANEWLASMALTHPPERVLLSNVAGPAMVRSIRSTIRKAWQLDLENVEVQQQAFGVKCAYDEPGKLGVDRWVGLVAARTIYPLGVCVIDAGSAITMDRLDAEGNHLGGWIAPGRYLLRQTLLSDTADIAENMATKDELRNSIELWGRDTSEAVSGGVENMVLGFVTRVADTLPDDIPLILTGGDGDWLYSRLSLGQAMESVPDLILQGLNRVAELT